MTQIYISTLFIGLINYTWPIFLFTSQDSRVTGLVHSTPPSEVKLIPWLSSACNLFQSNSIPIQSNIKGISYWSACHLCHPHSPTLKYNTWYWVYKFISYQQYNKTSFNKTLTKSVSLSLTASSWSGGAYHHQCVLATSHHSIITYGKTCLPRENSL